ncbi:MAG: SpoIIE family protein phosphatase [Leptospiraceae bacterium]|nr:SpoIIE family protein phosphatase [Leptospiraceae bacterium]
MYKINSYTMKEANSLVFKLTLRLELFTSILPIPIFVYFIALVGSNQSLGSINTIFLVGLICGAYTVVWGVLVRYFRINKIFKGIEKLKSDALTSEEKIKLKKDIMNYPFKEGKTIILRWIVGHLSGFVLYVVIMHEIPLFTLFVETYGLLLTIPISFIMYIFVTENFMREILRDPYLQVIEIKSDEFSYLGYFRRILIGIFSVTIIPISIFGFFLYSSFTSGFRFENPGVHIGILAFASTLAVLIVSYVIAKSIKTSLSENNEILTRLGEGNFQLKSSCTTSDDFGIQGKLIGKVIQNLKKLYDEITHLNENLEKKVAERTSELSSSLETITKLKTQQDGDYYLTSLLLKPLGINRAFQDTIRVEFLTKQKKQFEFRQKLSEIGGDLCRADTIYLKGKPYTLFLNADAMGKSIQGAGGALVLGAVIGSILERSRLDENVQNYSPEKWLKNSFIELHKIFESFEGSMLVSIVIGLVENETGYLYYINAEHPFTVLYRDKKAYFVDTDSTYRKLGVTITDEFIRVSGYQLFSNDIVINGSDGREDLIIGNEGLMSYPELFLEIVERGKGNIEDISNILQSDYELSDDLSLMAIHLSDRFISPEEKWKDEPTEEFTLSEDSSIRHEELKSFYSKMKSREIPNPFSWKKLLKILVQNKLFKESFDLSLQYIEKIPGDIEIIFLAAYAARKLGLYALSTEMGERVRIRNPEHVRNLFNLTYSYILSGNEARSQKLLSHLEELANLQENRIVSRKIPFLLNKLEILRKKEFLPLTVEPTSKY